MYYNTQHRDLIQSEKSFETILNFAPTTKQGTVTDTDRETEAILSVGTSAKKLENARNNVKTLKIDIKPGTTTSCTSSTDSGVNISDNDEKPSFPSFSASNNSLHSTPFSSPTPLPAGTVINTFNKEFLKNNKNSNFDNKINNDNNNNSCKNRINKVGDCDNDGDDKNVENNSTNFDNKLKSEQHRMQQQQLTQQFNNVESRTNGDNYNRYQAIRNAVESENVINNSTLPTANQTKATTTANKEIPSSECNDFINLPKWPTSLPLSVSTSTASSYEENPPSNAPNCNRSPAISIRSIGSSIIISESDSDMDLSGSDMEGEHENCVIKKLGTQVNLPPDHPELQNINKGHKILNQHVALNRDESPLSPLAALAAIGDGIGAAQALGPVPTVARPQIGSIALNNSNDVTFGDKHFYEGPVTIQQFLIDGRDKWKEGNDNPIFTKNNAEPFNKTEDLSAAESGKLYIYILEHKKLAVAAVLATTVLLITAIIFGIKMSNNSKNADDDECSGNGTLCFIERDVWRAHPQKNKLTPQKLPLQRAIISHTASEACESLRSCIETVRIIQEFHMNSMGWDDIGYNFLISSDGSVYVGRGWDAVGAHTKGYNTGSVGISFIGTYMTIPPTEEQLNTCLLLMEEGLRLKKLAPNYHVYGARQFAATESPGDMLYKRIKKWTRWSVDINAND